MKLPAEHTLATIWGHQHQIQLVRSMIAQERLPHALLLHGADGVGKRSLAFAIAKQIFTSARPAPAVQLNNPVAPYEVPFPRFAPDDFFGAPEEDLFGGMEDLFGAEEPEAEPEPLPVPAPVAAPAPAPKPIPPRPAPRAVEESANPLWNFTTDVHPRVQELVSRSYPLQYQEDMPLPCKYVDLNIIEPMERSRSIKVDQIRYLQEVAWIPPLEGRYRVILIFGADTITASAANSLLKFLEEPPSYLKLILVTDHYHQVLETIRSRCAQLFCQPLQRKELVERLVLEEKVERGLAGMLAGFSEGRVGAAVTALKGKAIQQRKDLISARISLDENGIHHLPVVVEKCLKAAGSLDEAALLLLALVRDRLLCQLAPKLPELVLNQDSLDLLRSTPGDTRSFLREAERLIHVVALRDHPLLPASEVPLELALWPK